MQSGMFDWDDGDRFSFEDSDRFEEDSLCSWISEPESLCNNWRGWKRPNGTGNHPAHSPHAARTKDGQVTSLVELAAREVACNIPFEVVEQIFPPVPEQLQLRIAFWSFAENEEDIRLYSCLANGSADEFQRGEHLFKNKCVTNLLQIGFHLSAKVLPLQSGTLAKGSDFNVAVTFDRRRITSCNCTCDSPASWCSHVVAVCLHRIHQPHQVCLRAPVSESLSRLRREQLQKFAQYLISALPQQILPTAQRLLDDLLSSEQTSINTLNGAPDPTAGASAYEQTSWCLDESTLHENIRKILLKLCAPSPIVFSDVNYLSSTAPPAAAEWSSLLRPLRGREPEGMWNLLSIVREMFRRSDRNAIPLLEIVTEEVLACDQILLWWFTTRVSLHAGGTHHGNRSNIQSNAHASQHACGSLCDEMVVLWRLAALNPILSPQERQAFYHKLHDWHRRTLESVWKIRTSNASNHGMRQPDVDVFPGFKPAMEACLLDWRDYPIPGITYSESGSKRWFSPYLQHADASGGESDGGFTQRRGRSVKVGQERRTLRVAHVPHQAKNESNRSSLSSEGFCENESEAFDVLERCSKELADEHKKHGRALSFLAPEERTTPKCLSHFTGGRLVSIGAESNSSSEDEERTGQAASECKQGSAPPVGCLTSKGSSVVRVLECQRMLAARHAPASKDEYQLYYFEPPSSAPPPSSQPGSQSEGSSNVDVHFSVSVKKIEDPLEILFARAEALHAHGHTLEACQLAVQLAEELLANPPNLMVEPPPAPAKGKRTKRFNPASHQIGLLASATMAKAAFLCSVLGENPEHHHLAFRVGLFGLEMARPPASTKALEVKLANQEQDIVGLLKRIPLASAELQIIRERAERLRDGQLRSRGEALLPLMLASFIFDALTLSASPGRGGPQVVGRLPTDETLGFEAAVAALGLKANVSEAEHPLLCEGTRRQRGDLAITLLVHYKDDQEKLAKIMDKLLDKEVHQMHKSTATPASYYSNAAPAGDAATALEANGPPATPPSSETSPETGGDSCPASTSHPAPAGQPECAAAAAPGEADQSQAGERPKRSQGREGASSPCWEEDYKAWEAKFRCTNFRSNKKHSAGMASIDSSAPETTSSDNSPTVVRRSIWVKQGGPGSDSGSSGESSDSFASSSSGDQATRLRQRDAESPTAHNILTTRFAAACPPVEAAPRCVPPPPPPPTVKTTRFKGKRGYPSIPNQPSEASAHFMFELAKTVLTKAGGNSSTAVLFTQPSTSQNPRGPHRALHICAFQIGLYALGLHNAVSANWLSRTYSSHVSWITGQAMEIGSAAISFLIDTWEGHLTPTEVATLADRASRGRDPSMVQMAAELALSCLPHAHALNPNEIQRALIQCKEQSSEMLERACLAVESAAKGGGVYPEVLFKVAHRWFELYEESLSTDRSPSQRAPAEEEPLPASQAPSSEPPVDLASTAVQVLPQITCAPVTYALPHAPYTYGYIQRVHPFGPIPIHPAYLPPPPSYAYPALSTPYYPSPTTTAPPHLCPAANPCIYTGQVLGVPVSQAQQGAAGRSTVMPATTTQQAVSPSPPQGQISQLNQRQLGYLLSAYRVGMLAMETLARRVHDDRPQAKYARNPQHGDDVKWLLNVAKKLGTSYLQEFCICAVNSVASPFVLHEIIIDTAHFLARTSNPPLSQPLRSHLLTPLIQKCQQMFTACTHFKMYHITPADYDEFVSIVRSARAAYQLSQGGMVQFNELLQSLRRSKSCKKELWQRIASSLASGGI